jgi:hypothetical protein
MICGQTKLVIVASQENQVQRAKEFREQITKQRTDMLDGSDEDDRPVGLALVSKARRTDNTYYTHLVGDVEG